MEFNTPGSFIFTHEDNKSETSCSYCTHITVCGIYDALVDATIKMDEFNQLDPDYEDSLYEVVAFNCNQFRKV